MKETNTKWFATTINFRNAKQLERLWRWCSCWEENSFLFFFGVVDVKIEVKTYKRELNHCIVVLVISVFVIFDVNNLIWIYTAEKIVFNWLLQNSTDIEFLQKVKRFILKKWILMYHRLKTVICWIWIQVLALTMWKMRVSWGSENYWSLDRLRNI
jgi:hypothetical protein